MIVSRRRLPFVSTQASFQNKKSENDLTELVEFDAKVRLGCRVPPSAPENPTPLEAMSPRLAFEP